jgi:hypothetical protein
VPPVTPPSDRARPIPASDAARQDQIHTALRSLVDEQARLERLGFELPLARCHAERRYWSFLAAVHALPRGAAPCDGGR